MINAWQSLADLPDDEVPFRPQQLGDDYDRLAERVELDKAWLRVLGVSDDKIDEIIDYIYNWLIDYMEMR